MTLAAAEMDYEFDLHPTHSVIGLTVTAETPDNAQPCF
jgi:hypothetical protein